MPGRAILILVVGIIVTAGLILLNLLRVNNNISENMVNDYQRKVAYNIAQSGANLGLIKLKTNSSYRNSGGSFSDMMGGKNLVRVIDTTLSDSSHTVAVISTGFTNYGTDYQISYVSIAIPPNFLIPPYIKGAFTANGAVMGNGNGNIDGRDHDLNGVYLPGGIGTYGIWSVGTISNTGGMSVGGTANNIDYAPFNPGNPLVIKQNMTGGTYPTSPDLILGGIPAGLPEGTLKSIAISHVDGSQYTNNPSTLVAPFSGVTFVDLNTDNNGFDISGSGILIINNTTANPLTMKLIQGPFVGIIILANNFNCDKFHGNVVGALLTTSPIPQGNVAINGGGTILYSRLAIQNNLKKYTSSKVVWFEQ